MSVIQHVLDDYCKSTVAENSSVVLEATESDALFFGPALPPQLLKKKSAECEKTYGPPLPDNFGEEVKLQMDTIPLSKLDSNDKILIGPELPEHLKGTSAAVSEVEEGKKTVNNDFVEDDDDDDGNCAFGPSTTLMTMGEITAYNRFKSTQNKIQEGAGETSVKRETWMVELPEKKGASLGLFPRHFKSRIQTDKESDNSVWTDTPADKERKQKLAKKKVNYDHKEILKMKRLQERDKEMEKLAKKAAKKLRKKESLLEMHLKNKKKKEKKEAKKREKTNAVVSERRPFDRNVDLQIRKFSQEQKRAILNKSQFLNDRFASGESKFL